VPQKEDLLIDADQGSESAGTVVTAAAYGLQPGSESGSRSGSIEEHDSGAEHVDVESYSSAPAQKDEYEGAVDPQHEASSSSSSDEDATPLVELKTPAELKLAQQQMEEKVYQIWTVLSAFEESSAGCISDMLLHVSNGAYYDGVQMAGRFILHVDILFSAMDDLELQIQEAGENFGKAERHSSFFHATILSMRGLTC
jgi:hypothetical protein